MDVIEELIATVRQNSQEFVQYAKLFALAAFGLLFLHSLVRFLFGKKAQVNLSVSAAMEIFCLYCILLGLQAGGLDWQAFFPGSLPFVSVETDRMLLFPVLESDLYSNCSQILQLLVIAFLVNLLNDWIPEGNHVITWYFFRFITVVLAIGANYLSHWLFTNLLPPDIMQIAPTILLLSLMALVLLGSLKLVVGIALIFVDPIIAGLYTFFFASFVGRRLARALLTTSLLTLLVVALDYLEISVFLITSATLTAFIPLLIAIMVLWYLLGRIL